MVEIKTILVILTIALYLLGRLCDDMGWYLWDGISTNGLEAIALGVLTASAGITIARRFYEGQAAEMLFVSSQMRFIIPWSLVILVVILLFNIFGCQQVLTEEQLSSADYFMNLEGCALYTVVILLTNLNYSLHCNVRGDLPLVIVFQVVLFAEIIYNGTLLIKFVGELTQKPKDYSILFVSIMIAWQMLVMDLLFRAAYEERKNQEKHQHIHNLVKDHNVQCEVIKGHGEIGTQRALKPETHDLMANAISDSNLANPSK